MDSTPSTETLDLIRDSLSKLVQDVLDNLESSEEKIELPMPIEFSQDLVIQSQKAKDIAHTIKRGILEKQLLIAVSQNVRSRPIEVGYIEPPEKNGKFISAIISPDYQQKLKDPENSIKEAIVQMHTLDLTSAALGIPLIAHGINVDRIVYSVNFG